MGCLPSLIRSSGRSGISASYLGPFQYEREQRLDSPARRGRAIGPAPRRLAADPPVLAHRSAGVQAAIPRYVVATERAISYGLAGSFLKE